MWHYLQQDSVGNAEGPLQHFLKFSTFTLYPYSRKCLLSKFTTVQTNAIGQPCEPRMEHIISPVLLICFMKWGLCNQNKFLN